MKKKKSSSNISCVLKWLSGVSCVWVDEGWRAVRQDTKVSQHEFFNLRPTWLGLFLPTQMYFWNASLLFRQKFFSEREARAVMEKVTNVVKYLHQNGVVHRYTSFVIVFIILYLLVQGLFNGCLYFLWINLDGIFEQHTLFLIWKKPWCSDIYLMFTVWKISTVSSHAYSPQFIVILFPPIFFSISLSGFFQSCFAKGGRVIVAEQM